MCSIAKDIGIDLGTASVLVYVKGKGVVLNEPSVVAIDKNTGKLLKVGAEAQAMLGRTPGNIVAIRPLREGVISDYDMTERMLREFLHKVVGGFQLFKPRVIICVPSGITEVEERAVVAAGDLVDELLQHPLGHVVVGDHALTQRTDGHDVAGGTAQHGLRLGAYLKQTAGIFVDGHHRRLVEHNALTLDIYQNRSGTQIDTDIFCQRTHKLHLIIIFVILCGNKPNFIQLSIILTAFAFCKSKLQMFTDLLKA